MDGITITINIDGEPNAITFDVDGIESAGQPTDLKVKIEEALEENGFADVDPKDLDMIIVDGDFAMPYDGEDMSLIMQSDYKFTVEPSCEPGDYNMYAIDPVSSPVVVQQVCQPDTAPSPS